MKKFKWYVWPIILLYCLGMYFLFNTVCSNKAAKEERFNTVVATGNMTEMLKQIDNALGKGNYAFAFKIINSFPAYFGDDGKIYYHAYSGEIYTDKSLSGSVFTLDQYVNKAVEILKAEADVLLTKDDPDAENLFLEHLADFELGANTVNIGEFSKNDKANIPNEQYQKSVTTYNDYLVSVIRKALVKNKPEFAQRVSNLIRDGLSFKLNRKNDEEFYIWAYDTEAKDEAKELINNYNRSN